MPRAAQVGPSGWYTNGSIEASPAYPALAQRREDRRERELAFARSAPVRIVEMHVRDQPGRQPAPDERIDRFALGLPGRRAVDHRAQRRVVDLPHDRGSLRDGVDERGLVARERLDAIGHARIGCRVGDRREALDPALAAVLLVARLEHALVRRAVHQNLSAELGAQPAHRAHHRRWCARAPRRRPMVIESPAGARSR